MQPPVIRGGVELETLDEDKPKTLFRIVHGQDFRRVEREGHKVWGKYGSRKVAGLEEEHVQIVGRIPAPVAIPANLELCF